MYSEKLQEFLEKSKVKTGDRIIVEGKGKFYEGLLMPRTEIGDKDSIVIKMDNGYNVGVRFSKDLKISRSRTKEPKEILEEEKFELGEKHAKIRLKKDKKKQTIAILHTGGTIASKVSYKIGGVVSSFTPEDLISMFPEIIEHANIETRLIRNMFSEDMNIDHYRIMAGEIKKEIKKGVDGVILTHGTDTMGYTSAALSFMLQDIPVPVILVGAQRSSDRPSSDAAGNLISAVYFITNSDFSGVAVCMHENQDDENCFILGGTKARKMHSSRRDAFRPVNDLPVAIVSHRKKKIKFLMKNYPKKDKKRKLKHLDNLERKVALVKIHPGMLPGQFEFYRKAGYRGLILEGTGLGHAPVNKMDEFTERNALLFRELEKYIKSGGIICMTSQTLYGRVNMNVYETGHRMQKIGVIPLEDMLPETAFVKLSWALGQAKDINKVKELMLTSISGEINPRITKNMFLF